MHEMAERQRPDLGQDFPFLKAWSRDLFNPGVDILGMPFIVIGIFSIAFESIDCGFRIESNVKTGVLFDAACELSASRRRRIMGCGSDV